MADVDKPFFRNSFIPLYDSLPVCIAALVFAAAVLFFGITGIVAARQDPAHYAYFWMPLLLTALSAACLLSLAVRLVNRWLDSRKEP